MQIFSAKTHTKLSFHPDLALVFRKVHAVVAHTVPPRERGVADLGGVQRSLVLHPSREELGHDLATALPPLPAHVVDL